ncbi:hypothetical protein PYJP_14920 [Pyrofollis japonicus]|nr:hypothetical protein PYJP_14920 [Pyrofollis japonicus]
MRGVWAPVGPKRPRGTAPGFAWAPITIVSVMLGPRPGLFPGAGAVYVWLPLLVGI